MTGDVQRLQYLQAMGITAWASRYRLPNARPTPACEWEAPEPETQHASAKLHALLDEAQQAASSRQEEQASAQEKTDNPVKLGDVRALLGDAGTPASEKPPVLEQVPAVDSVKTAQDPAQPLRFQLSLICLEGRWLSLQSGEISAEEQRLLSAMLKAAGIQLATPLVIETFYWPMVEGLSADDPLEEAREGLEAYIAGCAARHGWSLNQVLWWGGASSDDETHATLADVLDIANSAQGQAQSQALGLPLWQAPSLLQLLESAEAKRALWPELVELGTRWRQLAAKVDDAREEAAREKSDDH
ncbi:hypothetical protein VRRI112168_04565 [Vreelandella rituensis]|uniref:Uncharacterized protein n=1 Tax=Vreelandella rituensis TaxID=2282306 RepID=A0A368U8R2_9GAMM|nr:hypothetical protein [Halomonas rituensis]RCV92886.1 hypothetical protein DU506_05800 [Halomonas rituensis]